MRHHHLAILTVFLSVGTFSTANAQITTVPPGLNPGDEYRLVFITKDRTTALSTNIADYDAYVTSQANTSALLQALGTTWKVIGSTATVSAKYHTNTDDSPAGPNGVPIYRLDGLMIASDYDDLWDGTIQNPLYVAQDGTVLDTCCGTWTGTDTTGLVIPGNELGATDLGVVDGAPNGTGANWIQTSPYSAGSPQFLYGISDVLTVPGPGQIYEFQGHYYSWVNSYVTWDEAVSYADDFATSFDGKDLDDWHLVAITSAQENDFVWNTVLAADSTIGQVWLGAIVEDGSIGNFQWLTGEAFSYSNFAPGQPDLARETVLEMGGIFGPQWNDDDRDMVFGSVPQTFVIEHVGPKAVDIDIKPGSEATCNGSIPVAVLGSDTLDVTQIDQSTLAFEGLAVRTKPNGSFSCSLKDVDGDGYIDLLCQYQDEPTDGMVTGELLDGTPIEGADAFCVLH